MYCFDLTQSRRERRDSAEGQVELYDRFSEKTLCPLHLCVSFLLRFSANSVYSVRETVKIIRKNLRIAKVL